MGKISKVVDLINAGTTQPTLRKKNIQENEPSVSVSINQDEAGMSAKRPRHFAYMPPPGQITACESTDDSTAVKTELKTYLEEVVLPFDVNPLKYWNDTSNFKILKQFAKNILGCCATSSPSERVFSKAGNFYTPERAKLGPETFRALMLIKCNSDI